MVTPYILDVSKNILQLLRWPLSIILCLWFLAWLLGQMSITARAAFSSFCFLPGMSRMTFCSPHQSPIPDSITILPPKWVDFPTLMSVQDNTMEHILDENSSGSALALHIKKAQMATSDLAILVRHSNLKSRDRLATHLQQFAKEAESTSNSLTKLSSRVFGAVDSIMGVNDFALRTIEATRSTARFSLLRYINPWTADPSILVVESFETSMRFLSTTIRQLVVEFEINIRHLDKLEQQLAILHEIVSREGISVDSARSELLGELWTLLGGNKHRLTVYESNLRLLMNVGEYRKQALAHVVSALQKLRQMGGHMEDLRQRVSEPELIGGRIPLDVHIQSIQSSLERLRESQAQAQAREEVVFKEAL
ncbi:hypothetical protein C8R43DRAFT_893162 [Mycena crocata]|nr:hypothetical protein C8R43DRAFT_893162 [Mycena crocata]